MGFRHSVGVGTLTSKRLMRMALCGSSMLTDARVMGGEAEESNIEAASNSEARLRQLEHHLVVNASSTNVC